MYPLIESIQITDGQIQNIQWHNKRFNLSRFELFGINEQVFLEKVIHVPANFKSGIVKCRITYGQTIDLVEFETYIYRPVNSLKIVYADSINYRYKTKDRSVINSLSAYKGDKDDIVIVKNGLVSDSSYSNLVFSDGENFFTPNTPLLNGSKRSKYLQNGTIKEKEIKVGNIQSFREVHLINAFMDLGTCVVSARNIYY